MKMSTLFSRQFHNKSKFVLIGFKSALCPRLILLAQEFNILEMVFSFSALEENEGRS